jgi:hypothetical protein
LKYGILSLEGERFHGQDGYFVVDFYELGAADALLALAGAHFMVLHPARFIGRSCEQELIANGNGGGDVLHRLCAVGVSELDIDHIALYPVIV